MVGVGISGLNDGMRKNSPRNGNDEIRKGVSLGRGWVIYHHQASQNYRCSLVSLQPTKKKDAVPQEETSGWLASFRLNAV
jgi:hypothetical protein